ncbi:MAG: anaerobic ribonucleoside-triphosphate reductase activating protein [Candidatus Diapherotrites archaeon]|nr:anaerobic ribonucleoside-triphosphate reductase activating protein [Candidatus Diapherotrites archaeon]
MEFKGLQKLTLIDYPGKLACIVFTGGCNLRCPFCQNKDLVLNYEKLPSISEEEIIKFLESRRKWLDGIVITGGEPTIHSDLPEFIKKVKERRFLVKLDTNGSNPAMLKMLIENRLIDYIAMDVKAPLEWEKYSKASGIKNREIFENILKSIDILMHSNIDYEFRTTVVPGLHTEEDILKIAEQLKGARAYYLQQFRPRTTLDPNYEKIEPYPRKMLEKLVEKIKGYFKHCGVRG